jgi:mannan endo-1,4-beta-mannosidase
MNQSKWQRIILLAGIVFLLNNNLLAQISYTIQDSVILKNGIPWTFVGTDNMAVFNLPYNYNSQHSNCMDIVRECIDLKMTTDSDIESMVLSARNKGMVTILAGFWYDSDAFSGGTTPYPECQLLGVNPQQDPRWNLVMNRWKEIADLPSVKNHSDVWLNIWNEPYWWDGTNGYSDDMWETDAIAMIDTIRSTGASNIVVIEGSHTGQGHEVIINRGQIVRLGRGDVVFDIHVYNTLWNIPEVNIIDRFQQLKNSGNAFIVGEFANNGTEIWEPVINACQSENISLLSWLWGQYTEPFGSSFLSYSNQHCSALNLEYNDLKEKILIYPNPANDFIYLKIQSHIEECSIFNFAGQMINCKFEDNVIDVSNLITGIYLLKCKDHQGTLYSFKFTKY